jgi:prevent-host-death family protein
MTLHLEENEVGVRELHDRLSEYLERVEKGGEIVVTRRGKRIARLSAVDADGPLADLSRRGLVRLPEAPRSSRKARVKGSGSVSDLVSEQRR